MDDLKERRGYSHLKEEALDRTVWRARFGRGFGPVVRQNTEWMNELWMITIIFTIFEIVHSMYSESVFILLYQKMYKTKTHTRSQDITPNFVMLAKRVI